MNLKHLRLGNIVCTGKDDNGNDEYSTIESLESKKHKDYEGENFYDDNPRFSPLGKDGIYCMENGYEIEPVLLNRDWLLRFGFTAIEDESYINGKQFLFQVKGHHNCIKTEGIDRDGVWFDGIGTIDFDKTGNLAVNTLCRGNYCANAVKYVHELQNLYFALTGEELKLKPTKKQQEMLLKEMMQDDEKDGLYQKSKK